MLPIIFPRSTLRALPLTLLFAWLSAALPLLAAPKITVQPDRPDAIYQPGEKVTWTVSVEGDRAGLNALPYTVKKDQADEVTKGTVDLSSGTATISATRDEPGTLVADIYPAELATNKYAQPIATGAAMFSPEKITPSAPAPADFDAFWQAKLKELAAVPMNPQLQKVDGLPKSEGSEYYKVTLDNIRGTHVRAQLARPAKEGKFPAILMVQHAGVYALDKAELLNYAHLGWLALNVSAHDLPIDEPKEFYENLSKGELHNYIYLGSEDRGKSYFLRMFLGCVRGAEYLASRPDWNGQVLVVAGGSQGGLQSFVTAALHPKITTVLAIVPAGCDNYAPEAHPARAFGWPYWLSNWGPKDRDMQKVRTTAGYFDGINFAARIHCPTLIGFGMCDNAARPTGIYAAYNVMHAPKEIIPMPLANHYGNHEVYIKRAWVWKNALQRGQTVPPPSDKR